MRRLSQLRYHPITACYLIAVLAAVPMLVLAHEPTETIPEPGFRPESEHAASFIESLGNTTIAVLPSMIRRAERTAHSFDSQQQIIAFLNDSGLATAVRKPRRIDRGALRRQSQWDIFQFGVISVEEALENYDPGTDYTLVTEILVPDNQAVFGIQVYIMDDQGRSAFSFLLNSHHEMFANANLVARNSSEEARNKMIRRATRVGLEALMLQLELDPAQTDS